MNEIDVAIVGGGAAGIGAAGAARGTDKNAEVVVYTEYEDAAYSPCGIPYVHGKEISDFQSLFLATKESYKEAGIDIRYETAVTGLDVSKLDVQLARRQRGGTQAARRPVSAPPTAARVHSSQRSGDRRS